MRRYWITSDDTVKLRGHQKMHSGEPFTLVGNTFFGMLIIAHCIEFDQLCYADFKGDDSAIEGSNVRFNNLALGFTTERGLSLKAEYPCEMEFTGMFVTEFGYFPDVVRKTVKFLSTVFTDLSHYKKSILNLSADLVCIHSHEHLLAGASACARYYNEAAKTNKITTEDVILLTSFLHHQTTVSYDELPDVASDVLTYFTEDDRHTKGCSIDTQIRILNH
jgi:hypothetical protein